MATDGAQTAGAVLSGAAGGAATGSALGPWGALIGGVVGGISGGVKSSKAQDAQQIPGTDPMEMARLAELRRTKKQLETGTDPLTQFDIAQTRSAGRAAEHALARVGGGDVGSTISALGKAQGAVRTGIGQAVTQAATRIPYFDNAAGGLTSRIAQRKLELQLLNRAQKTGESAQSQTDSNVSGNALLGAIGGGLKLGEGGEDQGLKSMFMGGNQQQGLLPAQQQQSGFVPQVSQPAGSTLIGQSQNTPLMQGAGTGFTQGIPTETLFGQGGGGFTF